MGETPQTGAGNSRRNGRVGEAFASVLRAERATLNAQYSEARRLYPNLDAEALAGFLVTTVDPLVSAVARVRPDRAADVALAAYGLALELVGQKLAGAGSSHRLIEEGWQGLLTKNALLTASAPGRILAGVSNALLNLAATPGTRAGQWLTDLERLAPRCEDAELLLKAGQVTAWRAGLAHYRQSALATANSLPEPLALAAVGAPADSRWLDVHNRLLADPWCDPARLTDKPGLRVTAQAGAFRGFGGLFTEPPRVAAAGGQFLVRSGNDGWVLTADLFGVTFHRATTDEYEAARQSSALPAGLKVNGSKFEYRGQKFAVPALGDFTSVAANATTLALTSSLTHSVVLMALT
jgi:hypothetical protein